MNLMFSQHPVYYVFELIVVMLPKRNATRQNTVFLFHGQKNDSVRQNQ